VTDAPRTIAPYGSWASPFGFELLTRGVVRIAEPTVDGALLYWLEGRPSDGGRATLVRRDPSGTTSDVSPAGMNVRNRVHEYGGGAYLAEGETIVVSSFADGRLYRVGADRTAEPVTPEGRWRYADLQLDAARGRLMAVREDHTSQGEAVNTLVAIPIGAGRVDVLASGADFYASPRLSPDGGRLAWLEWNHPNLPWDGTELRVADVLDDGSLGDARTVAGSANDWISQPRWSPGGVLHFVAEPTGWMNLQRWRDDRIEPVAAMDAEFAGPDWQFGFANYVIDGAGTILAAGRSGGRDRLYRIEAGGGVDGIHEVETPYTELSYVALGTAGLVCRAAGPTSSPCLVRIDVGTGTIETLRRQTDWEPDARDLSVGEAVEFPTAGGRTAHGIFYSPINRRYRGPEGELPPLVVTSHGGPTSSASTGLSVGIQLSTSRGIAILDVDYGGSTGYGREYRKRLEGEWGVVDVDDCTSGERWLAEQGLVDEERMAIEGGSASGYTTLAALAFRDDFKAGISYFGIGDLEAFVRETHKFESRYLERLIGPWPDAAETYAARSPAKHADQITVPVLILQGLDDHVVPPTEAERIVDALWERRIPHAYLPFEGEDHGFRKAENIIRSAEAEISFLGQVFSFTPADDIEAVNIEYLEESRAARR
jgi:dipeptidyl aminopeptidase/acylaminoacyl peptidase